MIEQLREVPPVPRVVVKALREVPHSDTGFLRVRAERLQLVLPGGQASGEFDYFRVERTALDAVVVAAYFFPSGEAEAWVVLRSAVRPPVSLRHDWESALRSPLEAQVQTGFWELPAGLIEAGERSAQGELEAAVRELEEEAGLAVAVSELESLGAASYPCAGVIGERQTFFCVQVDPSAAVAPSLDGSELERAGRVIAVPLGAALRAVRAAGIADMKSELGLRRLAEKLGVA